MQIWAKNTHNRSRPSVRRIRAFTMVEIALSLAVVAFALVAIIGILPTGMTVQKDNREDTLINQEGRFWIEAIKSGARGLTDLTNYVEEIRIAPTNPTAKFPLLEIANTNSPNVLKPNEIIGLLSIPKFEFDGDNRITNRITARVRAITGPATEQSPYVAGSVPNTFRYQLQTEITPYFPLPPELVGDAFFANTNNLDNKAVFNFNHSVSTNLWDVRLVLRWPVIERGTDWYVGNNRKTFRAQVSGVLQSFNKTNFNQTLIDRDELYLLVPNHFDVAIAK
jgi:type II secretory pathway pseudopilin PulG